MEEVKKLFKDYEPIESIYENEEYYIAFPQTDKEPLAVYYSKEFNDFKDVYFYQKNNNIVNDVANSRLIFGKKLDFSD